MPTRRLACLLLIATAAAAEAQPVRNPGRLAAEIREMPSSLASVTGYLEPGASAVVEGCDAIGRWCRLTTARGLRGWIDTDMGALIPDRGTPLPPPTGSAITVTPLPDPARPLPDAILDAVPRAATVQSGIRLPTLLSTTAPVRNVTDGPVNLRAGPGTGHAVVGGLAPGEGGPIQACDATEQWCVIRAPDGPGWVKMTLVGERRLRPGAR